MAPSLDTQKLGFVFESRPDILNNIQKAAGKYSHPLNMYTMKLILSLKTHPRESVFSMKL